MAERYIFNESLKRRKKSMVLAGYWGFNSMSIFSFQWPNSGETAAPP